jgi:hypothetical protein
MRRSRLAVRATLAAFVAAATVQRGGAAPEPPADAARVVAFVYDFHGPASAFRITRAGAPVALAPLLPLALDDRVQVVTPADAAGRPNTITLDVDGAEHALDAHNATWCVGRAGGSCGAGAALESASASPASGKLWADVGSRLAALAPALKEAKEDFESAEAAPPKSRGAAAPPTIPILHTSQIACVATGLTTLAIPLAGGARPLDVKLYAQTESAPLAEAHVTDANEVRFTLAPLAAGTYRVTVSDATGADVSETFKAIAPADIPPPDPDLALAMHASDATLHDAALTGYAAYLLVKNPRWSIAAYQSLQAASPAFPAARALLFRLGEGP